MVCGCVYFGQFTIFFCKNNEENNISILYFMSENIMRNERKLHFVSLEEMMGQQSSVMRVKTEVQKLRLTDWIGYL